MPEEIEDVEEDDGSKLIIIDEDEQVIVSKYDIQTLEKVVSKLKYENNYLLAAETLLENKCASLDSQLQEYVNLVLEKDRIIKELNTKIQIQTDDLIQMNQYVAELKQAAALNGNLRDAIENQESTNQRVIGENDKLRKLLKVLQNKLEAGDKFRVKVLDEVAAVKMQGNAFKTENDKLTKELSSLRIKSNETSTELERKNQKIEELEEKLSRMKQEADNQTLVNSQLSIETESTKKRLEEFMISLQTKEVTIKHLQEQNMQYLQEIRAQSVSEAQKKPMNNEADDINKLKVESEFLRKELESTKNQLIEQTIETRNLRESEPVSLNRRYSENRDVNIMGSVLHEKGVLIDKILSIHDALRLEATENILAEHARTTQPHLDMSRSTEEILSKSAESIRWRKNCLLNKRSRRTNLTKLQLDDL